LGAEALSHAAAKRIAEVWFRAPFESGGRHERRVKQIAALERRLLKGARRR
ncbi:MAG: RpiB/LacA/LacB family sugar-phosphate isomerase, partial [Candidatus Omnitrophica bacterium]|nr:RpiB/LacA/LacB family sugar-phosphate isomerase [Candidatus Omnitrophota bacterium]